jgi:hypothetical protein
MLADMLLESGHAQALSEYEIALKLSPNRLNGLYNTGRAAEAAGEAVEGAVLLRGADEIHKQRPKLHSPRANSRQAVRLRHPVGS